MCSTLSAKHLYTCDIGLSTGRASSHSTHVFLKSMIINANSTKAALTLVFLTRYMLAGFLKSLSCRYMHAQGLLKFYSMIKLFILFHTFNLWPLPSILLICNKMCLQLQPKKTKVFTNC